MSFPQTLAVQQAAGGSSQAQEINFLSRTCAHCETKVLLGAGDVLYGEKWYHGHCWGRLRSASSDASKAG